ncbi:hypothetical protein ZHAS_00013808 [Anopheles sinensis]|uniref:Uncharacterized protein n=1 Tax=Anopheles sinensis TaxID=74873 RepID=A0A084W6K7_ANOSI|nr:hypothetical protein ZHAS_00013808 [Anopheles sinensis]
MIRWHGRTSSHSPTTKKKKKKKKVMKEVTYPTWALANLFFPALHPTREKVDALQKHGSLRVEFGRSGGRLN